MTENPEQEAMGFDDMNSVSQTGELGENGIQKNSDTHHVNGLQPSISNTKSDVFVVDMERFSHLIEKDMSANSRITLQRNLSRKGTMRGGGAVEKKINSMASCNERDTSMLASSPRATLHGGSMPEKAIEVAVGANDHSSITQIHHQITINNGNMNSTGAESSKWIGRRFSFRRFRRSSPATWIIDPRRILFFFATLSCIGTILLIYFTLSMGKLNTQSIE